MPDDDRTRRRLSDATKGRIADLASGWDVAPEPEKPARGDETMDRIAELASGWSIDATDTPEESPVVTPEPTSKPVEHVRKKQKTLPPPPPGSHERAALEAAILDANTGPAPKSEPVRGKPPTAPPPLPKKATGSVPALGAKVGSQSGSVPAVVPKLPPKIGTQSGSVSAIAPHAPSGAAPLASPTASSGPVVPKGGPPPPPKVGSQSGSVPALARGAVASPASGVPATAPQAKSGATAKPPSTVKSGPTETGTVNVSGVIGGMTPSPVLVRTDALPGVASIKDALPLRADTTDRTGAPPMPPPGARPRTAPPTKPRTAPPPGARPPIATLPPDESGEATEVDPTGHLTVPIGEFDQPSTVLEQDKLRIAYQQATIKRDAASALLGIAEQPLTVVKAPPVEMLLTESAEQIRRGDATSIDPQTQRFERGDPTLGPDATTIDPPSAAMAGGGKLRTQAALRRKRGIGGDVRYVATVLSGVRRARRELGELELQQVARVKSRARHLLTLGRTAVITEGYDHPALNKAREALAIVEDERAQHAAQVSAADSELMRVRTDRADKAKAYAETIAALDAELADIAKKLEPLEKEVAVASRKAGELHEALRRIDAKIAATEASKVSVKGQPDPAAIQAELATHKADRLAVERDEPKIAAELDALNPRIAALEARRTEARKRRVELEEEEKKDQGRAQELLAAIGAKRVVVDRAAADAEAMRDKTLLELGERIYVDRPDDMAAQLAPIDTIDVELGTTDRRMMELKEILSSIDKAKLARGIAVIVLVLGVVGSFVGWLIYALS